MTSKTFVHDRLRVLLARAFVVLWALLACGPSWAEPPVEAPYKPLLERAHIDWYGIYMQGAKIGWARITLEPKEQEGAKRYRLHAWIELKMKSLGAERDMRLEQEALFEAQPPYRTVGAFSEQTQGAFSQRVELVGEPGAFQARVTAGGQTRTQDLPEQPVGFLEEAAPTLWFRSPRAVGDTLTHRTFDLDDLEGDREHLTVKAVEHTRVDGVPLTYYTVAQRSEKDGSVSTARYDGHGRLISMEMAGAMEIRLEPESLAKRTGAPVDVFVARIARIDTPLGSPENVVGLVVEVRGPGIEHIRSGPRQRAELSADGTVLTLHLGAAEGPEAKATPEEIAEALRETPDHPIRDRTVMALAQAVVGETTDAREKVRRLVRFVDGFIDDSYAAEPLSVQDILTVREGDCTEHSLLLATLARAVGIPARQVGGLMYMGDEVQAFGGHAWNEVVLDGVWVPVDATWGQVEVDATHIRQSVSGRDTQADLALAGARLTLVSVTRRAK